MKTLLYFKNKSKKIDMLFINLISAFLMKNKRNYED